MFATVNLSLCCCVYWLCSIQSRLWLQLHWCHCVAVCIDCVAYRALYDYNSTDAGDLTFFAGDVIIVHQMNGDWWTGSVGDRSGMFPANYVEPLHSQHSQLVCHCCLSLSVIFNIYWYTVQLVFNIVIYVSLTVYLSHFVSVKQHERLCWKLYLICWWIVSCLDTGIISGCE